MSSKKRSFLEISAYVNEFITQIILDLPGISDFSKRGGPPPLPLSPTSTISIREYVVAV